MAELLGISLDGSKVDGQHFVFNLKTPDNSEQFVVELSNSTLTNIQGQQVNDADLTITLNRSDLERVIARQTSFDQLIADGKASFDGDRKPFELLMAAMTTFTPDLELLPGTTLG